MGMRARRVVETDHGAFVLLNVYVPNAGDRPPRPRLEAKLAFLVALQGRVRQLLDAGRQVRCAPSRLQPRQQQGGMHGTEPEASAAAAAVDRPHCLFHDRQHGCR